MLTTEEKIKVETFGKYRLPEEQMLISRDQYMTKAELIEKLSEYSDDMIICVPSMEIPKSIWGGPKNPFVGISGATEVQLISADHLRIV